MLRKTVFWVFTSFSAVCVYWQIILAFRKYEVGRVALIKSVAGRAEYVGAKTSSSGHEAVHNVSLPSASASHKSPSWELAMNGTSTSYAHSLSCTQEDIERWSGTIVLVTTNAGFLDVTENMLESVKRARACPSITIIAEDELSYQILTKRMKSQRGLHVQRSDLGATESKSLMFDSPQYTQFVRRRPHYVLSLLEKGRDVLFVDSDTFWFKDPFEDLQGNFDIAMHNEKDNVAAFCDGFAYYRRTNNTLRFVREWVRLLNSHTWLPDQRIMNQMISEKRVPGLKIKTLNETNYPDGRKYFHWVGWREKHNDTTVLHLTFVKGHDAKVKKLKEFGWWLI
ncbi:UDP-D-xylose:L-fucose alpha-1,3-D-xylosyltransferase 1-like [Acanthaster planci]|uniref:UDP-D-xylose:L-fucose alpha-1,3-D-xylosyltransferase 1-like n=1 Tax=Acanthaster planci TaxID=133434 RepID=A0A8B7Y9V3_ACAPL|nr:UDP-D-xylose:L-fucose alpha-1,3-D-xylosyltransferase 1-like [Acanthaster planci]